MIDAIQEIHAVALAVYHESRGEPLECQVLVASVVKHRMNVRGLTAREVISQSGQFTWYKHNPPIKEVGAYAQSLVVARLVLAAPKVSKYEFFHRGKSGDYRCGKQVFNYEFK